VDLKQRPIAQALDDVEQAPITPAEKGLVKDYLRKSTYTTRRDDERPSKAAYINVCFIDGTLYQVVGRIDHLRENDDGSRTLIEMKNRTKCLFNKLRDYEEVQCRVYLAMLPPSVRDALLVESYEGEMKSYLVMRDEAQWTRIRERLEQFCAYFHERISYKE
jgi:hypothetical protein